LNSIEFLLDNGVDDVRLNKQDEASIHLAIIHNQLDALKVRLNIFGYYNSKVERKNKNNFSPSTILTPSVTEDFIV
jgi:ankyrin repeat protein